MGVCICVCKEREGNEKAREREGERENVFSAEFFVITVPVNIQTFILKINK